MILYKIILHITETFQDCSNDGQTDGHYSQSYDGFIDIWINFHENFCCDGESLVSSPGGVGVDMFQGTTFTTPTPVISLPQSALINVGVANKLK